ncbi:hypothetical protein [Sphingobacterium sp. T2]|nr:hypothetical protein [Sphingobacterium sp. T2]
MGIGTKGILENTVLSNWGTGLDVEHDVPLSFIGTKRWTIDL